MQDDHELQKNLSTTKVTISAIFKFKSGYSEHIFHIPRQLINWLQIFRSCIFQTPTVFLTGIFHPHNFPGP